MAHEEQVKKVEDTDNDGKVEGQNVGKGVSG